MPTARPDPRDLAAYAALIRHPDPLVREVGVQLRDGHLRPRDILSSPAYRGLVDGTLERLRRGADARPAEPATARPAAASPGAVGPATAWPATVGAARLGMPPGPGAAGLGGPAEIRPG
jgi:hypothetical protein